MIIRTQKNKDYTVMRNTALNDENLSLKAVGLWAWLMSKPDNWEISVNGVYSQRKEGRDAIRSAMQELAETGYLLRGDQERQEDGTFSANEAILYETPRRKTRVGKPVSENPIQVNTDKVNTDKVSISKDIPASSLMKPEKKEYGNPEVNKLIETFTSVTGLRLVKLAEQRRFASLLIKANGIENCLVACGVVAATIEDQYAPRISDIKELYYKWGNLQVYARKKNKAPKETGPIDLDGM